MTKSKIFSLLLISFIGGVFLYSIYPAPQLRGGILITGFFILIFAIFIKRDHRKIIFGFCILMLAFGVWRSFEVFSYRDKSNIKNFDAGLSAQAGEKLIFPGKII